MGDLTRGANGCGVVRTRGTGSAGAILARRRRPTHRTLALLLVGIVVTAGLATADVASASSQQTVHGITAISLASRTYRPHAAAGMTDDYHCTLLDPHSKRNAYVISSQFRAGSREDHHAVVFLVPPSMVASARHADAHGNGWTCFGLASLPALPIAESLSTPMIAVWSPGHGADVLPKGTGIEMPAGSLLIMQVHYNLLVGDRPVRNSLVLDTVPMSAPLLPLQVQTAIAPPDIPCPAGVTGQLCNRTDSLANQAMRFGPSAVPFVNTIESVCGRDPAAPPIGDTASCNWPIPVGQSGYIVRVQAHMHLLGVSFTMVLDPGTPQARTVLDVPNYNFDYQKAYNLRTPIPVRAGDKLQVTCTYDPRLGQELPILRKAAPHFVTWGDGSSDEMCVGLAWTSTSLPNAHAAF